MWKRIKNKAFIMLRKTFRLRVGAYKTNAWIGELPARFGNHTLRNVHTGNTGDVPPEIIGKQNAGATGNVQNGVARLNIGGGLKCVQTVCSTGCRCVSPCGGTMIEKRNNCVQIHGCLIQFLMYWYAGFNQTRLAYHKFVEMWIVF